MFPFSKTEPRVSGISTRISVPLADYLSSTFSQGLHDTAFTAIADLEELRLAREGEQQFLTADEANTKYGLPGLKWTSSVGEEEARLLNQRKNAELQRQYILSQGDKGFFSWRNAAALPVGMLASIANPLDFGMMFLPMTGSAKAGRAAKIAGRGTINKYLARGIVTEEALASTLGKRVAPYAATVIDAAAGNAITEIPILYNAKQERSNYTIEDSLINITAGAAFSGVIRLGLEGALKVLKILNPETKEIMWRQALSQFLEGKDLKKLHEYVNLDEKVIRERIMAKRTAWRSINDPKLRTALDNLKKKHEGKVGPALIAEKDRIYNNTVEYLSNEGLTGEDITRILSGEEVEPVIRSRFESIFGSPNRVAEGITKPDKTGFVNDIESKIENTVSRVKSILSDDAAQVEVAESQIKNDFWSRPENQQAFLEERRTAIKQWLEGKRQELEQEVKDETAKEVTKQLDEGRVLTPQQTELAAITPEHQEKNIQNLEKQVEKIAETLNIPKEEARQLSVKERKFISIFTFNKYREHIKGPAIKYDDGRIELLTDKRYLQGEAIDEEDFDLASHLLVSDEEKHAILDEETDTQQIIDKSQLSNKTPTRNEAIELLINNYNIPKKLAKKIVGAKNIDDLFKAITHKTSGIEVVTKDVAVKKLQGFGFSLKEADDILDGNYQVTKDDLKEISNIEEFNSLIETYQSSKNLVEELIDSIDWTPGKKWPRVKAYSKIGKELEARAISEPGFVTESGKFIGAVEGVLMALLDYKQRIQEGQFSDTWHTDVHPQQRPYRELDVLRPKIKAVDKQAGGFVNEPTIVGGDERLSGTDPKVVNEFRDRYYALQIAAEQLVSTGQLGEFIAKLSKSERIKQLHENHLALMEKGKYAASLEPKFKELSLRLQELISTHKALLTDNKKPISDGKKTTIEFERIKIIGDYKKTLNDHLAFFEANKIRPEYIQKYQDFHNKFIAKLEKEPNVGTVKEYELQYQKLIDQFNERITASKLGNMEADLLRTYAREYQKQKMIEFYSQEANVKKRLDETVKYESTLMDKAVKAAAQCVMSKLP